MWRSMIFFGRVRFQDSLQDPELVIVAKMGKTMRASVCKSVIMRYYSRDAPKGHPEWHSYDDDAVSDRMTGYYSIIRSYLPRCLPE